MYLATLPKSSAFLTIKGIDDSRTKNSAMNPFQAIMGQQQNNR
jgi:hypothetical protein